MSEILSHLEEWRQQFESVAEFGIDVNPQLATLIRFHQLVDELARPPERMSTRELATAEGCSERTVQRRKSRMKSGSRGPVYNRQKAIAGASATGRKPTAGGMGR